MRPTTPATWGKLGMTPKQCFDNVLGRARRLLTIHDGLVNRRRYKIRADWARSFKKLMHWPQAANIGRVDSPDAIIVLKDGARLAVSDFSADTLDDLLRASLVFGVSALDRYIHERVVKGIVNALRTPNLTRRQEEFSIPAVLAIRISEEVARARRLGRAVRPANEVRKKIQEILHKRPFQNWTDLEYAFELLGSTNLATQLRAAYGVQDIAPIRTQLNGIAYKRNLIVHEGDLVRHERGGKVRKLEITRQYVEASLNFLDDFVAKLDSVT
jgi:hypothetical protein